ncbi:hypothetical protein PIROE2DRAFT_9726, partial [Piromyces sp. E2]
TLINAQKNGDFTCVLGNQDLQSHSDNYNCNTGALIKGRSKSKRSFDSYSDGEESSDNDENYEYYGDDDTYTYPEAEEDAEIDSISEAEDIGDFDDSSNIEESNDDYEGSSDEDF